MPKIVSASISATVPPASSPGADPEWGLILLWAGKRFWSKVDRSGGPNACWPWTALRKDTGYGRFRIDGRMYRAHRLAFQLAHGEIPAGYSVCHRCDNPPCCNPAHLFAAPQALNMRDSARKGRSRNCPLKGAANPQAKLCEAQVTEIRARYQKGIYGCKRLAREFGVSYQQIHNIVTNRSWQGA